MDNESNEDKDKEDNENKYLGEKDFNDKLKIPV